MADDLHTPGVGRKVNWSSQRRLARHTRRSTFARFCFVSRFAQREASRRRHSFHHKKKETHFATIVCVVCFCRRLANFFFPHCPVNSRRHNNKQQPTTHNFIKKTQKTTATNKHTHTTTVPRSQLNSSRTTVCSTLWDWQQKKNQFLLVVRGGGCVHIYLVAKLFSNSIAARALNTAAKRCKQHRLAQRTGNNILKIDPLRVLPNCSGRVFPLKTLNASCNNNIKEHQRGKCCWCIEFKTMTDQRPWYT